MNTPTHLLISSALLTKPGHKGHNWAVLAGALLPDAYLYGLFLWSKIVALPEHELWRRVYWQDSVQFFSAISNSIPIYGAMLVAGLAIRDRPDNHSGKWAPIVIVFGLSSLLHMIFDFLFHHSDAHRHFWPLMDWRFHSPVSYWDSAHNGQWVGLFESILALALIVVLLRRFQNRLVRGALALAAASYVLVPAYFTYMLG